MKLDSYTAEIFTDDAFLLPLEQQFIQKKSNKNIKKRSHTINVFFFCRFVDNGMKPFVRESDSHLAGFY